jgi:hypothetical protein
VSSPKRPVVTVIKFSPGFETGLGEQQNLSASSSYLDGTVDLSTTGVADIFRRALGLPGVDDVAFARDNIISFKVTGSIMVWEVMVFPSVV